MQSCISCQEMKLKCKFAGVVASPVQSGKRRNDDGATGVGPSKRRKVEESEAGVEESRMAIGVSKEMWDELVTAIRIIGARVSDLSRSVSDLRTGLTDIAWSMKKGEETRKEMLEEVRQMVWVQDQTRGMVHVVAKRLESLDGVERIPEWDPGNTEIEKTDTKGKEKEIIPESEGTKDGESEGEDEEEAEDVERGPEISTLVADESMEMEV